MPDLKVLLISTYELGRQPFGLASPAAWLRAAGFHSTSLDLSRQSLDEEAVRTAGLIAFYLPMHTATGIAVRALERVRKFNPTAHLCAFGLYAPVNAGLLRCLGFGTILGGEFEQGLLRGRLDPLPLDGSIIEVDSTDFAQVDVEVIFREVSATIGAES